MNDPRVCDRCGTLAGWCDHAHHEDYSIQPRSVYLAETKFYRRWFVILLVIAAVAFLLLAMGHCTQHEGDIQPLTAKQRQAIVKWGGYANE